ncbi:MAG: ABC transporter permease [Halobacteriota archaeon]
MVAALVQQLLDGLTVGMSYALLAAGLSVIFGVMRVINFAHGELYALGAYFALTIVAPLGGAGFYLSLLIAPVLVGIVGVAIERYTVRPLYGRNPLYHVLLTFGLVFVINDLIIIIWGAEPTSLSRPDLITGTFSMFGASFSRYTIFILFVGGIVTAAVWAALTRTKYGLIVRAGAQDRRMVRNLGISIDRYYSLVFGVGAALAAIAGIIIAGRGQVTPSMGFGIIIPAFVIVILGGLGSFKGAVLGGLGVGVLQESIIKPDFPAIDGITIVPAFNELDGMIIFLLMIGILLIRPQGLFGSEFEEEDGELLVGTDRSLLTDAQRGYLAIGIFAVLVALPLTSGWLLGSTTVEFFMIRILIWGLFALALDFIMGYTGLVSLGHALFWGIGAYVSGTVLVNVTPSAFVAAAVAVLVGGTVAWVVGYLSIRVHGVYFAMITLAFAELFYNLVYDIDGWIQEGLFHEVLLLLPGIESATLEGLELTGGSEGLFGFSAFYGIGGVGTYLDEVAIFLGPITLTDRLLLYYVVLAALVVAFLLIRRILQSPFGRVLKAIRENETRAQFLGYNPTVYKQRAFTISGVFATLAGVLFALESGFVSPEAAEWIKSGEVIVMVILGGMGTLFGPLIGAFAFFGFERVIQSGVLFVPLEFGFGLIGAEESLPDFTRRWRLFLGTAFVLFVVFLPRGLISLPGRLAPHLPARFREDAPPGEPIDTEGDDG